MRVIESETFPWWGAIAENFRKDVSVTKTELSSWLSGTPPLLLTLASYLT